MRIHFAEAILDSFPILPINLSTARAHARLWTRLAATGLAHGLTLATANIREFERVEGLEVENWAANG